MTAPPTANGTAPASSPGGVGGVPLYDLALDVPHPAASSNCPPPKTFSPPGGDDDSSQQAEIIRELSDVVRIQRFSFPEYDERVDAAHQTTTTGGGGGAGLNRHDVYLQNFKPQMFIFALQLKCGSRVHGHVRRYLPHHRNALSRGDVGRRGERALVILTRIGGADRFFDGVLATCAALTMERSAMSESASLRQLMSSGGGGGENDDDGVGMLLRSLYLDHAKRLVDGKPRDWGGVQGITLHGVEFGPLYQIMAPYDTTKFHFATSLLSPSYGEGQVAGLTAECTSPLLPLLRRLGPSHTLRLLSALLCERRIILISKSPTRLSSCASGAMSMLSQGDLKWQHVYVPVVPPHLIHHLAAPVPYVVGLLSQYKKELGKIPGGLGEVVTVDLDDGGAMQVYGTREPNSHIPDLLRASIVDDGYHDNLAVQYQQQNAGGGMQTNGDATSVSPYASLPECLGGDLTDVIKSDRASLTSGNRAEAVLGAAAVKATGVVKAASKFLGKKGGKKGGSSYNRQQSVESSGSLEQEEYDAWDARREQFPELLEAACVDSDEYAANARAEEEVRVAFLSFFVALLGDPATFLSRPADPSQGLFLDREKFVRERRRRGDYEGTPLYSVLTLFVRSQMFEQFGKARALEVTKGAQNQQQPTSGSLFALVSDTVRRQNLEFNALNVRRVARHVAARSPSEKLVQRSERIRSRTLALTSKQGYENQQTGGAATPANATQDLAALTEECRDATGPMLDALGVVWSRIRDSRGMNSKHALLALIVLRNLVLHGPLAAVALAVDAVELIRLLKSYSNKLSGATAGQIRAAAGQLYELLVDRTKLFVQRRTCAVRRREVHLGADKLGRPKLVRDRRVKFRPLKFGQVHELFRPAAGALSAAAAPPSQDLLGFSAEETAPSPAAAPAARPKHQGPAASSASAGLQDLLGFEAAPARPQQQPGQQGAPQSQQQQQQKQQQAANGTGGGGNTFDMLDLFNASVDAAAATTGSTAATGAAAAAPPPFDPFQSNPGTPTRPTAAAPSSVAAAPTVNQHPQQQHVQGQQVMYSQSSSFGSAHSGPGPHQQQQQQHNQATAAVSSASTLARGQHANQTSPTHSSTSSSSSKEHQQHQQKAAPTSTGAMQASQPNWQQQQQQQHQQKSAQAAVATQGHQPNWQQVSQQQQQQGGPLLTQGKPLQQHPRQPMGAYPQQQAQQQYVQNRSSQHGVQQQPQQKQPMGGGSPYHGQGMMGGSQQPMPTSAAYPHQAMTTLQQRQTQQPRQMMKTTHTHTEVSVEVQLTGTMQHQPHLHQHQLHSRGAQVGPSPGLPNGIGGHQQPSMMGHHRQPQQPGGMTAFAGQQQGHNQVQQGHHAAALQGHSAPFHHQQGGVAAAQQPSAAYGGRPQTNPPPRASIDSFDPMAKR